MTTGGNDFFEVTEAFHNALQSNPYEPAQAAQDIFPMYNEQNRERMRFDEQLVVINDPPPLALARGNLPKGTG